MKKITIISTLVILTNFCYNQVLSGKIVFEQTPTQKANNFPQNPVFGCQIAIVTKDTIINRYSDIRGNYKFDFLPRDSMRIKLVHNAREIYSRDTLLVDGKKHYWEFEIKYYGMKNMLY